MLVSGRVLFGIQDGCLPQLVSFSLIFSRIAVVRFWWRRQFKKHRASARGEGLEDLVKHINFSGQSSRNWEFLTFCLVKTCWGRICVALDFLMLDVDGMRGRLLCSKMRVWLLELGTRRIHETKWEWSELSECQKRMEQLQHFLQII